MHRGRLMKRTSGLLLLMLFGFNIPAAGQQIGDSYRIEVERRPTIREQLDLGRQLVREARMVVNPQERMVAVGVAAAHLEDVRLRWPDEKRAVVIAKLIQADLYSSTGLKINAIEALESVLETSKEFPEHVQLLRALGRDNVSLRQGSKAKAVYDRLEGLDAFAKLPVAERSGALAEIAESYRQLSMFEESAIRYERAALLPGVREIPAMVWLTAATEDWLSAENSHRAKASLAKLEARFDKFNRQPLVDDDSFHDRNSIAESIASIHSKLEDQKYQ